jgi:hypothetical protein
MTITELIEDLSGYTGDLHVAFERQCGNVIVLVENFNISLMYFQDGSGNYFKVIITPCEYLPEK